MKLAVATTVTHRLSLFIADSWLCLGLANSTAVILAHRRHSRQAQLPLDTARMTHNISGFALYPLKGPLHSAHVAISTPSTYSFHTTILLVIELIPLLYCCTGTTPPCCMSIHTIVHARQTVEDYDTLLNRYSFGFRSPMQSE